MSPGRRRGRPSPCAALALALALGGCLLPEPAGDRLFRAGDLTAAADVYRREIQTGHARGRRRERALYHLGLIHARPDSDLYDPAQARRYLERLLAIEPPSRYAIQAAVILELQIEVSRLRTAMADQTSLARLLLAELRELRAEAERVESAATDEQERARRLARRIDELQTTMADLAAELAAREEELERLKRIDLEDPP